MNGMEVSTAVHYGKQVIWVVLNDAGYGMIHHALRMMKLPDVGHSVSARRLRPGGGGTGGAGLSHPGARARSTGSSSEGFCRVADRPCSTSRSIRTRWRRSAVGWRPWGTTSAADRRSRGPPAQTRPRGCGPSHPRSQRRPPRPSSGSEATTRNITWKPSASASRPMMIVPPPTPSSQHAAKPATLLARFSGRERSTTELIRVVCVPPIPDAGRHRGQQEEQGALRDRQERTSPPRAPRARASGHGHGSPGVVGLACHQTNAEAAESQEGEEHARRRPARGLARRPR